MTFVAGLIVGCAAALAVVVLARRPWRGRTEGTNITTWVATAALVLSIVALARSGNDTPASTANSGPSATTPATAAPTTPSITRVTSTPGTDARATVVVPNLVGLPQAVAVSKARGLGLETDVQTLALSATPSGYVVSQTPLPDSRLPTGSTVALVVSSPA